MLHLLRQYELLKKFPRGRFWSLALSFVVGSSMLVGFLDASGYLRPALPRLVISRQLVDLGVVEVGKHSVDVTVSNSGGRALLLHKPRSSCNCTTADMPAEIAPGGSVALFLNVHVAPGLGSSEILLRSNDPTGAEPIRLRWIGVAKPILLPGRIACESAPLGSDYEEMISLFTTTDPSGILKPKIHLLRPDASVDITIRQEEHEIQGADVVPGVENALLARSALLVRVRSTESPQLVQKKCRLEIDCGGVKEILDLPIAVRFSDNAVPSFGNVILSDVSFASLKGRRRVIPLGHRDKFPSISISSAPDWLDCSLAHDVGGEVNLMIEVSQEISSNRSGTINLRTERSITSVGVSLFALH